MLTPEEELRLALISFTLNSEEDWEQDKEVYLWLAEKLKEVNEELKARETWCTHNCGSKEQE